MKLKECLSFKASVKRILEVILSLFASDLLHLIENVFTLTPALTLT